VDVARDRLSLCVTGRATIVDDEDFRVEYPGPPPEHDRAPRRWVVVEVDEACLYRRTENPPAVDPRGRDRGTDDAKGRGGDYFGAKGAPRPWHQEGKGPRREPGVHAGHNSAVHTSWQ
jgi:uncharacterized protein